MTEQAAVINHISNLCWETRGETDWLEVLKVSKYHPDLRSEVSPHAGERSREMPFGGPFIFLYVHAEV